MKLPRPPKEPTDPEPYSSEVMAYRYARRVFWHVTFGSAFFVFGVLAALASVVVVWWYPLLAGALLGHAMTLMLCGYILASAHDW